MLKKEKFIKKIEFIFAEEKINPISHVEYEINIIEEGKNISSSNHRETISLGDAKTIINEAEGYVYSYEN